MDDLVDFNPEALEGEHLDLMAKLGRETLKPCPFCGGDAETEHYSSNEDGPPEAWVRCGNADCKVNSFTFGREIGDAVADWNRRAEPWKPMWASEQGLDDAILGGEP